MSLLDLSLHFDLTIKIEFSRTVGIFETDYEKIGSHTRIHNVYLIEEFFRVRVTKQGCRFNKNYDPKYFRRTLHLSFFMK